MGEDATPEETSGTEPAAPEPTTADSTTASPADITQELPVVPAETTTDETTADETTTDETTVVPGVEAPATEPADTTEPADAATPILDDTASGEAAPTTEAPGPDAPPTDTPPTDTPPTDTPPTDTPPTDTPPVVAVAAAGPAHAAPARRSLWRPLLGVVASLAILAGVGLAGYAYGRSSAPGPDIIVQSEPVTEEPADAEAMPVSVMPSTVPPILSVRNEAIGAPTAVLSPAAGLDDTAGTAMGYRLVNSGISGGQIASVLATAFGVKGSTVQEGDTWTVGKKQGPQVVVTDDALFSWTFQDPERLANPIVGQQIEPADAIELANTVLSGIGVDTTAVDWQVERFFDRTSVTAWQLIAEQRTQLRWLVAFDPEGAVVEAAGFSAGLEPVASYSVVGAATAVKRSNTAPWWTLGATLIAPAPDGAIASSPEPLPLEPSAEGVDPSAEAAAPVEASPDATTSPAPLASGDPVFGSEAPVSEEPSPDTASSAEVVTSTPDTPTATEPGLVVRVDDVVVTEASLGLAQFWQPDGSVLMLPSYVLTGLDGSRWSLIAVSDEYVAFVPSTDPLGAE